MRLFLSPVREDNQQANVFWAAIAEQEWSDLSFQRLSTGEMTGDSVRLITTQIVSPFSAVAAVSPARRAAKTDPIVALREE